MTVAYSRATCLLTSLPWMPMFREFMTHKKGYLDDKGNTYVNRFSNNNCKHGGYDKYSQSMRCTTSAKTSTPTVGTGPVPHSPLTLTNTYSSHLLHAIPC